VSQYGYRFDVVFLLHSQQRKNSMSQSSILVLLAQQNKTSSEAFWASLEKALSTGCSFAVTLNPKAKQRLVEIFRYAASTEQPGTILQTTITLIMRFAENTKFIENFTHTDAVFFSAFAVFVSKVITKPSERSYNQCKANLIKALDLLFQNQSILRQETIKVIVSAIASLIQNVNDVDNPIPLALAFIHKLITKVEASISIITSNPSGLISGFQKCQSPRIQMQILNILWLCQVKTHEFTFNHDSQDNFIDSIHKMISHTNSGLGGGILTLEFGNFQLPNNEMVGNGWIDIGNDDLMIYFGERIVQVPFDAIEGLNLDGPNLLSIEFNSNFPDLNVSKMHTNAQLEFTNQLSPPQVSILFSKISRGESQPLISECSQPKIDSQSRNSISESSQSQTHQKSSIALFQPTDGQNTQTNVDTLLFEDTIEEVSEVDIEQPPPQIENVESSATSSPEIAPIVQISPPPPTIQEFATEEDREKTQQSQTVKLTIEPDNFFGKHTIQITDKLTNGIDALTRTRMEGIERFGQMINCSVESLKEDIRTTMRDREHGSLKQLETSKEMFQLNLQQFKRKAGSMHQTLLTFEEESSKMTGRITEIQRQIRKEIQQRRIDLENELKNLRRVVRRQNKEDSSDLDDDVDEITPPLRRG
jgi:hypothetical protein